jgi:hypothetical protein
MIDLEKQLNELPQGRLSKTADLRIRFRLYEIILKKSLETLRFVFVVKEFKYTTAFVLLLSLVVAVPGYAYASDSVTLNNPLYPIKIGLEKIEVGLSFSNEQKAETYAKLAERRMAEAEVLSNRNDKKETTEEAIVKTVNKAVALTQNASYQAKKIDKISEREKVVTKIEKSAAIQTETLRSVAAQVGINASEKTVDSIASSFDVFSRKIKKDNTEREKPGNHFIASTSNGIATPTTPVIKKPGHALSDDMTTKEVRGKMIEKKENTASSSAIDFFERPEVEQSLDEVRINVEKLRSELKNESFDKDDVDTLFNRLDKKVEQAQKAIKGKEKTDFQNLMQSTQALTDNAKHFMKQKNDRSSTSTKNYVNKESERSNHNDDNLKNRKR